MADTIKVFAGSSAGVLTEDICRYLGCLPGKAETRKFYNDCTMVRIAENVRGCDVFVVQTATPPVNDHLMELLMLIDALKGRLGPPCHRGDAILLLWAVR